MHWVRFEFLSAEDRWGLLMEHLEDVATGIDINDVLIYSKFKDLEIEVINFYLRFQSKEFVAVF